ncbi:MAG: ComEC/Rec2 family competence protein [Candidatus Paceibacterota bacterium]
MPLHKVFFYSGLFFLLGVTLKSFGLNKEILLINLILILFLLIISFIKNKFLVFIFILPLISIGSIYYQWSDLKFHQNDFLLDQNEFIGTVIDNPNKENNFQEIVLEVDKSKKGKILVRTDIYPGYYYGDKLLVKGNLSETSFEGYKKYLEKEGITGVVYYPEINKTGFEPQSIIKEKLFSFKNKVENSFKKSLPSLEASFLTGLTLGGTSGLTDKFKKDLSLSGTTHLVALSGYNVSIIIFSVVSTFSNFLSRKKSLFLALFFIIGFTIMTGADPSIVRASIMGGLVIVAHFSERFFDMKNALIFSALLMILINPKVLIYDVGFQLSFLALLGIIYLKPIFHKIIKFKNDLGFLSWKDNFLTTVSAQVMVAPILIINFDNFSLISLLANVAILELIPSTMALGFILFLMYELSHVFSLFISFIVGSLLFLEIKIIEFFADFKLLISLEIGIFSFIIYYLFLLFLIFYSSRKTKILSYV